MQDNLNQIKQFQESVFEKMKMIEQDFDTKEQENIELIEQNEMLQEQLNLQSS